MAAPTSTRPKRRRLAQRLHVESAGFEHGTGLVCLALHPNVTLAEVNSTVTMAARRLEAALHASALFRTRKGAELGAQSHAEGRICNLC
jgi:hypothetical protein